MEKDKQPQAGQAAAAGASAPKAQEPLSRAEDYAKQLNERQALVEQKKQAAWAAYYKKTGEAYKAYLETVQAIQEGATKKLAAAQGSEASPAEALKAFKAARAEAGRSAQTIHVQLRNAEDKYNHSLKSFWDEVYDAVADAVNEFWDWIKDWWEEPPVEGVNPLRTLGGPAWRPAFDPSVGLYHAGWNYGPSLS